MAKPKGATLTQLFAVSDKEREQFWAKIRPGSHSPETNHEGGPPATGIPFSAVPFPDTPVSRAHDVVNGMPPAAAVLGFPSSTPEAGIPEKTIPDHGVPVFWSRYHPSVRRKVREATKVQDGHSLGEQAVYAALWAEGQPHTEDCRRITVGYRSVSDLCGLTVNNCKANLQALRKKLAIEEMATATPTQGTTYLVYGYQAILRRRRQAGLTHVIRTRGVQFVNPETGKPVSGVPEQRNRVPETGTPASLSGTPVLIASGVPVSASPIRDKKFIEERGQEEVTPTSPSSFPAVAAAARRCGLTLDDDAVRRIVLRCRAFDETATEVEVAHFLGVKVQQLSSSGRVRNWPGLLIKAVPEYFAPPATELLQLRELRAQELEESREVARRILADPEAPEADRAWAEAALAAARSAP